MSAMKVNLFKLFLCLFLLFILASTIFYPLRYLKYTLPLFAFPFYIFNRNGLRKDGYRYYYYLLVFYSFVIIVLLLKEMVQADLSARFIPNAVFILSPLLFFIFIQPFYDKKQNASYVKLILYACILMFFVSEGSDLLLVIKEANFFGALLSSEFPTESNLAYVFGFLFLYFILEEYPIRYKLIAFIFLLLCFKRVVLGATLASIFVYALISFLKVNVSKRRIWLVLTALGINLLFVQFTILIVDGVYDQLVYENTGLSLDRLLMGRKTLYSLAFEGIGNFSWFGAGLGSVDDVINDFYGIHINLHSEVLRNYLEFGVVFFVLWIVVLFYQSIFSLKSIVFLCYLNILLLTDNVFIYFEIMFYFYLFIQFFLTERLAQINSRYNV